MKELNGKLNLIAGQYSFLCYLLLQMAAQRMHEYLQLCSVLCNAAAVLSTV